MVTNKIQKVSITLILFLGVLNILPYIDWEYRLFFGSDKLYIDERIEEEVNDVIKEFYKQGVPLHQIGDESFMISIDDCMLPYMWGLAEGSGTPHKVFISLNKELLKYDNEFQKWVITHELAHELGYFHQDDLLIMKKYPGKGGFNVAFNDLIKNVKENKIIK